MKVSIQSPAQRDPNMKVLRQCGEAQHFIDSGDYSAARECLSDVWRRIGERPDLRWLDTPTTAEVLLRIGVLTGWIGSSQQIPDAQEIAKNLISEAIEVFRVLGNEPKVAEAQIDLSLCYWREGAFLEARTVIEDALIKSVGQLRAHALVNKSTIEVSCGGYHAAIECLDEAAPLLSASDDHALLGRFHNQHAAVLSELAMTEGSEFTDRALIEYEAASAHFELAGDVRYQCAVESNLGYAYFSLQRHAEALIHLDNARRLFTRLNSRAHIAQVDETRAQVFLSLGRCAEAETAARAAVTVLREGDEAALLAEALRSLGTARARLGKPSEAHRAFQRAISASERCGDLNGAGKSYLSIIEELHEDLTVEELQTYYGHADEIFSDTVSADVMQRLRACIRRIINQRPTIAAGETLHSAVLVFEKEMVKRALIASSGGITQAAKSLGITHQGLAFMLEERHEDLRAYRKEKRTRRRSIIKRPRPRITNA